MSRVLENSERGETTQSNHYPGDYHANADVAHLLVPGFLGPAPLYVSDERIRRTRSDTNGCEHAKDRKPVPKPRSVR